MVTVGIKPILPETNTLGGLVVFELNGVGVDPSIIEPLQLQINSGSTPSTLTFRVHQSHDVLSLLEWINIVTLSTPSDDPWGIEPDFVWFRGILTSQNPAFSTSSDTIIVTIPDFSWIADSDFAEYDLFGVSPVRAINTILDGALEVLNTDSGLASPKRVVGGANPGGTNTVGVNQGGTNDQTVTDIFQYFPRNVRTWIDTGTDLSVLGDSWQNYQISGMPAYQAILEIIRRSGNFLTWLTYNEDKALLNIQERKTGEPRSVTMGNFGATGDDGGTTDLNANVVSIRGSRSQIPVANRWVGRGDRIIYETTRHNPYGSQFDFTADWDTDLEADVLANPGLTLQSKYAAVGRRYRMVTRGIKSSGFIGALASSFSSQTGNATLKTRAQGIHLLFNEPQNDGDFHLYRGGYRVERVPPNRETVGGDKFAEEGDLVIKFKAPQVYAKRATSQSTFVAYRTFRMTFAHRVADSSENKSFGRVSADSGVIGNHPIVRARLLRDSNFKYIVRRSQRMELNSDDTELGVTTVFKTIKDDRKRLQELCKRKAQQFAEPSIALQITLHGNKLPDFSWQPGQRIVEIKNSDGFSEPNLDVVGVMHDFTTMRTTIFTDNLDAFSDVLNRDFRFSRRGGKVPGLQRKL